MSTPVTEWRPGMDVTAGRLQYMLERLAESITVRSYGAKGDGITDDAPAIQSALDYCRDQGGGWVVVPPGTYLLSSLPLRIYGNTRLTLLDGAEFRRNAAATVLVNGDAGQNYGGYTGHSRIVIEGGLWNMRGTTTGLTASAMCISIGHAQDITIRDLEVRDLPGYHAVELNSTKRGVVDNCKFRGYIDPGGRTFSEAVQIDLAKSSSVFGAFGPYDNTECQDILVTGCHFGASGTSGTTAWPRGVGSHSATIGKWHRRIRVVGCSFENLPQYAISAYNWEDLTVTGCTFTGCGSGVRLRVVDTGDANDTIDVNGVQTSASQSMKNFTVTGNTFRSGAQYDDPITCIGESTGQVLNVTIGDNTIDTSNGGQNGIRMLQVQRFSISGNSLANIDNTAISTESCLHGAITGNLIAYSNSHGITSVTNTHCNITGNMIVYSGGNGILVQDGSYIQLRDNFIRGAGRATNNTYYGIRLSTNASSVNLSGNKVRPNGSGNEAAYAYSVTDTVTVISRYGNDWRGTYATGTIQESTTAAGNTNTSAADLT